MLFLFQRIISIYYLSQKSTSPEVTALLNSLTNGFFCFISVPICFSTFKSSTADSSLMYWLLDSFQHMMDHCITSETADSSRNFKFIILYSCLLHNVYTSFTNILDEQPILSTIKKGAVLCFFASTYCFG